MPYWCYWFIVDDCWKGAKIRGARGEGMKREEKKKNGVRGNCSQRPAREQRTTAPPCFAASGEASPQCWGEMGSRKIRGSLLFGSSSASPSPSIGGGGEGACCGGGFPLQSLVWL
ncbi:MAG: hypothetical protein DYG96_08555 [Chlorobi bacterium CHB2]|nr:hypothetical protein [Chlorobi bacterium CHB2]